MRILYFSNDYSTHDHRFLAALARTEHQVSHLRLEQNDRQIEDRPVPPEIEQIPWAGAGAAFRWAQVPRLVGRLRRLIRDVRPDLIHAGPVQTCAFLAVLSGFRPVLTMSWGFDLMQDADRNAWWRMVTRYTLSRSTFFVSDADVTRARAIQFGMRSDRTAVFPWGVDLQRFRPAAPKAASSTNGEQPIILFCDRSWEPRYGVDVLARAFVKVAQERPDVSLLLMGAGSQAQQIRQILNGGRVMDRTQLPGRVSQSELPGWYQMADIYISPSHVDGSSVSLMEALACGLPALVSDIPANKEWVTEGDNGWLFPDGNAEALAEKILAAIKARDKLPAIAAAARRSAEAKADWSRNFPVLLDAYEKTARAAG